jgi:hypothetical protein
MAEPRTGRLTIYSFSGTEPCDQNSNADRSNSYANPGSQMAISPNFVGGRFESIPDSLVDF